MNQHLIAKANRHRERKVKLLMTMDLLERKLDYNYLQELKKKATRFKLKQDRIRLYYYVHQMD